MPLSRASDDRLARRASKGDHRALSAIFGRYERELFRFCLAMLGDPDDAQDALQNTMVKVLRSLPGEEREIALRPWLYKIARNEAIELRRTEGQTEALDGHLRDRRAEVSEQVEQREHLGWLLRDLNELPERQRAVLLMRELSGLEFADIGAALGTSSGVVRQSLYEARRNLEQMDFGRSLRCASVMKVISDADGRITRRREIRAHLRGCPDCRRFEERIGERKQTLAAISPLPAGVAAGIAQSALAGAGASGGVGGAAGVGVVKAIGGAGLLKAVATAAVVATVGTAVERPQTFDLDSPEPEPPRSHAQRAAPSGASAIQARSVARAVPGPSSLAAPRHNATSTVSLGPGAEANGGASHRAVAGAHGPDAPSFARLAAADGASASQAEQPSGPKTKAEAHPEHSAKQGKGKTKAHPEHSAKPEKGTTKAHPEHPAKPEMKPKPEKRAKPEKTAMPPEAPGQTSQHPEHPAHPAHSQKPDKQGSSSTPTASPPPSTSSPSADPTATVEDTANGLAKGLEKKLGRD